MPISIILWMRRRRIVHEHVTSLHIKSTLQEKALLIIQKFEITGQLGILPSRARKQIPSSSVEDVATAVVEASNQSPHGSVRVPVVSLVLDMPYSTVRKILRRILNFYPYKIKPVHLLQDGDSEVRTTLEFLARMVVDVTWPWNIL
ncbi:hypothetical protein AVEN_68127-1 [Araneus ventricosus]|uniref:DUF4817 domain-containing protein n=1 Tax=Araneus ventricosus TaxID=182803 RepID=A0A4Y2K5X2_ARAVE|nr:hypothetical protein AVEN_68127-1 [Araneus ventricosus]